MTRILVAGLVALAGFGFVGDDPPQEERDLFLEFLVVDSGTGRPVEAAPVVVTFAFSGTLPPWPGRSGAEGLARVKGHFKYEDNPSAFGKAGKFATWGRWLEVSASGFQTLKVPLPQVLGQEIVLDGGRPVTVKLKRGRSPDDSHKDLTGLYRLPESKYYGSCIELKPDGRFAWSEWGHQSATMMEYGKFRRAGDRIELTVIPAPNPAEKTSIMRSYRIVEWGDGLFLCNPRYDAPRALARWAFRPPGAEPLGVFDGASHRGDETRKPGGLPRLKPREWARFAYGEVMDRNDPKGVSRAWINFLIRTANSHLGGSTFRFVAGAIIPELAPEREDEN